MRDLVQAVTNAAKRILGDLLVFRQEVVEGIHRIAGKGFVRDVFGRESPL